MARPFRPLTAQIENVIRARARGEPNDQILQEYYGIGPDADPRDRHAAMCKIARLKNRPDYDQIWADELSQTVKRYATLAINRICSQLDNKNDWLANKAASDLIALASRLGAIRNEEASVKVTFEGMPEIGSPDHPEEDG